MAPTPHLSKRTRVKGESQVCFKSSECSVQSPQLGRCHKKEVQEQPFMTNSPLLSLKKAFYHMGGFCKWQILLGCMLASGMKNVAGCCI